MTYIRLCLWALCVLWHIEKINNKELTTLWIKSLKLFASFLAFTDDERPKRQLRKAMESAELSGVYDLDSDIRPITAWAESVYLVHLPQFAPDARIQTAPRNLFRLDVLGQLSSDGLERGSIALACYRDMICSRWMQQYSVQEIHVFGWHLQIFDDVLDIAKDRLAGDKNCLLGDRRHVHIAAVDAFMQGAFYARLEQNSWVYRVYFRRQWRKARPGLKIHTKESATMRTSNAILDHQAAVAIMAEVRAHMMLTRPGKYDGWFMAIDRYTTIARLGDRFSFIPGLEFFEHGEELAFGTNAVYSGIHAGDDIADGDADVPPGFTSAEDYIGHILRMLDNTEEPREPRGMLTIYGLGLLQKHGIDIRQEIRDVTLTLKFDAARRSRGLILIDREELEQNDYFRDESGTIGSCLKIAREQSVTVADIAPLGRAMQIAYTLRDMAHDVLKLMLNVPREDFRRLGMYIPDPTEAAVQWWLRSAPVRRWRAEEAERGLLLLHRYQAHQLNLRMHVYTRKVLEKGYARKAGPFLQNVLRTV